MLQTLSNAALITQLFEHVQALAQSFLGLLIQCDLAQIAERPGALPPVIQRAHHG
ncbi:MAG: hypothetical protein MI924_00160 [Chloroflexales bacterium]|nr:hypothetical protein [Chloroflexales bacterium]